MILYDLSVSDIGDIRMSAFSRPGFIPHGILPLIAAAGWRAGRMAGWRDAEIGADVVLARP